MKLRLWRQGHTFPTAKLPFAALEIQRLPPTRGTVQSRADLLYISRVGRRDLRGVKPGLGIENAMAERAPVALAPEPAPLPVPEPEPEPEPEPVQPIAEAAPPQAIEAAEPSPPATEAAIPTPPPEGEPTKPAVAPPRRGWRALSYTVRRVLLAPVLNRLDDDRKAAEGRRDRLEGVLHGRFDAQTDALLRRDDRVQDAVERRADQIQDALLKRLDRLEAGHQRLLEQAAADISGRLSALEGLARSELAAGRETARRLEDQDAELGRLRAELSTLREQSDLLLKIVGPRFDELEIKVRPLIAFDEDTWAVRLADGYVLVPRSQPEFAVQVANAPSGGLEAGTRRVLQALIQPGMCVADVGANVGLLTLACARAAGDNGLVHAFEPEPGPRALLGKMARLNGLSAEIHAQAAGTAPGRLKLHVSPIIGHSSLYELPQDEADDARVVEVPVTTLDEAVPAPIDVAKIDVEGAELDVLAGMARHLKESPDIALVTEFGPAHLVRAGVTPEAWWLAFKDQGFLAYAIEEPSGVCAPAALRPLMKRESTNLAFVRRGGAAERRLPRA